MINLFGHYLDEKNIAWLGVFDAEYPEEIQIRISFYHAVPDPATWDGKETKILVLYGPKNGNVAAHKHIQEAFGIKSDSTVVEGFTPRKSKPPDDATND